MHNWRAAPPTRLGILGPLAEVHTDHLDWHQVAGWCSTAAPRLALGIVSC
ncbi:MAG: hypothetical protein JO132_14860 [Streptosporangiaceae bacterium]|nr:hypothetical protein [Streptosporangiaceae bacterium]